LWRCGQNCRVTRGCKNRLGGGASRAPGASRSGGFGFGDSFRCPAFDCSDTEISAAVDSAIRLNGIGRADIPHPGSSLSIAAPTSPASAVAPPPSGWDSAIVPDFPKLFEDFKAKEFTLLWRGTRDGFRANDFHNRCDEHSNTLTVILDTEGNIFGVFTPAEWESLVWNGKHGTITTVSGQARVRIVSFSRNNGGDTDHYTFLPHPL
jgi:hypothetical protein